MQITHDDATNVTYYRLNPTDGREIDKTVKVSERCNVDIDEKGLPIGVEVLH